MKQRRLTPLTLWALAFGCCIGWGAFIVSGTTFAVLLGALVMILIVCEYGFYSAATNNLRKEALG